MPSSSDKKRRTLIPETEREYWRRIFFDELHSRIRVRNLILQDLRPLWRDRFIGTERPVGWREHGRYIDAVASGEIVVPGIATFRERLDSIVSDTLRCRESGKASTWVAAYLMAAVQDRLPDGPFLPDPSKPPPDGSPTRPLRETVAFWPNGDPSPLFEVQIILQVGPYGASVMIDSLDASVDRAMFPHLDTTFEDDTGRWDDWDTFSKVADSAVAFSVGEMRAEFERRNPRQANLSADERRHEDIRALLNHLVDRRPVPGRAERERLRRLARFIQIDFPIMGTDPHKN